jgi:hypothetical protein
MSNEEKENILDQHKHLYDGYVTKYNQESNQTPIYVQDLANDKNGITLNNKGEVKSYRNVGINESPLDRIADGDTDLKNGTVDLDNTDNNREEVDAIIDNDRYPSPSEDDSLSEFDDEMEINNDQYEYDIDELEDYSSEEMGEGFTEEVYDEVDEDILPEFKSKLQESLDMFKRFKNYN